VSLWLIKTGLCDSAYPDEFVKFRRTAQRIYPGRFTQFNSGGQRSLPRLTCFGFCLTGAHLTGVQNQVKIQKCLSLRRCVFA